MSQTWRGVAITTSLNQEIGRPTIYNYFSKDEKKIEKFLQTKPDFSNGNRKIFENFNMTSS